MGRMKFGHGLAIPSFRNGGFNPLTDINGLSLYMNKSNATVSSWLDQSPNAYDFVQVTASKQPTISANSVDYDGTDDEQAVAVADAFVGDASGIVFYSGYFDNTKANIFLESADEAVDDKFIGFQALATGELRFIFGNGATLNNITSTNTITNGAYFYGYIKSTGSAYEINLNGSIETPIVVSGSNDGKWFSSLTGRDNLSISSIKRLTPFYAKTKVNKIIYSNDHTIDTAPILNFMSNPNN